MLAPIDNICMTCCRIWFQCSSSPSFLFDILRNFNLRQPCYHRDTFLGHKTRIFISTYSHPSSISQYMFRQWCCMLLERKFRIYTLHDLRIWLAFALSKHSAAHLNGRHPRRWTYENRPKIWTIKSFAQHKYVQQHVYVTILESLKLRLSICISSFVNSAGEDIRAVPSMVVQFCR